MKTFKAIEVERVSEAIYKAIIEQRLKAGTRLVETRLVEIFSANRNHVRAAIKLLSQRKVVIIHTNKGAFVANPDKNDCKEIFDSRRVVECGIITEAARKCGKQAFKKLTSITAREQKAIEAGDRQVLVRESGEFHLEIARIYGNSRLYEVLEQLIASSSLVAGLYERNEDFLDTIDEHTIILENINSGKFETLPQLMSDHLTSIENKLLRRFEEHKMPDLEAIFS